VLSAADLLNNHEVQTYITKGNEYLGEIGFTEHGFRHVKLVSDVAFGILEKLGYPARTVELAAIAGLLHDIGNVINRNDHSVSGALMAFGLLERQEMPMDEIATVIAAIGNHDEQSGRVVSEVSAALILADKSDVHRGRVRNQDFATFDIHDRVNFAVEQSDLQVYPPQNMIVMDLRIDTAICPVMEYFEIFLTRMVMCRRAAGLLDCRFALVINGARLL